jgi:hypothetical protein
MDQHALDFFPANGWKVANSSADKVIQLGYHFDAGEPATADHERQQPPAKISIGLVGRFLQRFNGPIPEAQRIAQRTKGDGVLGHAWHSGEIRNASRGQD